LGGAWHFHADIANLVVWDSSDRTSLEHTSCDANETFFAFVKHQAVFQSIRWLLVSWMYFAMKACSGPSRSVDAKILVVALLQIVLNYVMI
jgi:hypothetical protein